MFSLGAKINEKKKKKKKLASRRSGDNLFHCGTPASTELVSWTSWHLFMVTVSAKHFMYPLL